MRKYLIYLEKKMDKIHLIVSLLCVTQLMLLQSVLRLKIKIRKLEREKNK